MCRTGQTLPLSERHVGISFHFQSILMCCRPSWLRMDFTRGDLCLWLSTDHTYHIAVSFMHLSHQKKAHKLAGAHRGANQTTQGLAGGVKLIAQD